MRSSARGRRLLVRWVFLVVTALLVAQAAYAYAAQEPYPSFVFPSFPGAPDEQGSVRVLRPRLIARFADPDRMIDVPYEQLLAPAPGVVADAIAYTVFAPPSSDPHPRSVPGQFRLFLEQPTFARGDRTLSVALRNPTTRAWLRGRLAQLFPGYTPRSLEIRWDQHHLTVDDASTSETVRAVTRLRVTLDD